MPHSFRPIFLVLVRLRVIMLTGLPVSFAEPSDHFEEVDAYFFLSGDLIVFVEDAPSLVSKVSKDKLYIQKEGHEQAVGLDTRIGLKITPVVANAFLKVEGFDYMLSNQAIGRKEVRMLSELSFSQSMSDEEVGDIRSMNPMIEDRDLVDQEDAFRQQMERQIDDLRMLEEPWLDSVRMKFTVTPSQDMRDVYVVCGLAYRGMSEAREQGIEGSRMIVHYLGHLNEGVSKSFQFDRSLERFQAVDSDCELFFYEGNAKPIAHTLARKLRPLNKEETTQVRDLLSRTLSN